MEALDVFISAAHHASVDISQPIRMCCCHHYTNDNHDDISDGVAEEGSERKGQEYRHEEHYKFDDELQFVLEVSLRRYLLVEWQRLLVIHSQLKEQSIGHTSCDKQVGENHQYRESS